MVVGVTPMGLHYVLDNVNDTYVGAAVSRKVAARRGDYYDEPGRLAYPEVCVVVFTLIKKMEKKKSGFNYFPMKLYRSILPSMFTIII